MSDTPSFLKDRGLRLVPVGGRPAKTTRDVAVFLALRWFEAGAPEGRPKLREAVLDLWAARGFAGIRDPAHVTARAFKARALCGADGAIISAYKGAGSTRKHVGPGAGVLLIPAGSATESPGVIEVAGPVWSWEFGAEHAELFDASGEIGYGPKP